MAGIIEAALGGLAGGAGWGIQQAERAQKQLDWKEQQDYLAAKQEAHDLLTRGWQVEDRDLGNQRQDTRYATDDNYRQAEVERSNHQFDISTALKRAEIASQRAYQQDALMNDRARLNQVRQGDELEQARYKENAPLRVLEMQHALQMAQARNTYANALQNGTPDDKQAQAALRYIQAFSPAIGTDTKNPGYAGR
ncbi:hypothetical protein IGB42_01932 [Andreprevotia sp. IGB-42]|uniref:hypothetical protein n=1 Tax=Andreprevotia sp. IGB-42 TaxID=2497473 RepID=UPI00135756E7|nr:hypothetical protein [Andreprevotia sp. IGB-42]KAF0813581.1 hypothetical protein IGB42_01932 [Andreprevotia sp. IGB-42]